MLRASSSGAAPLSAASLSSAGTAVDGDVVDFLAHASSPLPLGSPAELVSAPCIDDGEHEDENDEDAERFDLTAVSPLSLAQVTPQAALLAIKPGEGITFDPAQKPLPLPSPPAAVSPLTRSRMPSLQQQLTAASSTPNGALLNTTHVAALGALRMDNAQRAMLTPALQSPASPQLSAINQNSSNAALVPGQQTTLTPFGGAPKLPPRPLWLQEKIKDSSGEPFSRVLSTTDHAALAAAAAVAAASAGVPAYPAFSCTNIPPAVVVASPLDGYFGAPLLPPALDTDEEQHRGGGFSSSAFCSYASSPLSSPFMMTSPSASSSASMSSSATAMAAMDLAASSSSSSLSTSVCGVVRKTSRAMSCSSDRDGREEENSMQHHLHHHGHGFDTTAVASATIMGGGGDDHQHSHSSVNASPTFDVRTHGLPQALLAAFVAESLPLRNKGKVPSSSSSSLSSSKHQPEEDDDDDAGGDALPPSHSPTSPGLGDFELVDG